MIENFLTTLSFEVPLHNQTLQIAAIKTWCDSETVRPTLIKGLAELDK